MEYDVKLNEEDGQFEVALNGEKATIGFILIPEEERIVFTHTEVPDEYSGKGIASLMAGHALDYARKENLRVSSMCSFIDSYIQKNPEHQKLLG
jgi:hypothetical protein